MRHPPVIPLHGMRMRMRMACAIRCPVIGEPHQKTIVVGRCTARPFPPRRAGVELDPATAQSRGHAIHCCVHRGTRTSMSMVGLAGTGWRNSRTLSTRGAWAYMYVCVRVTACVRGGAANQEAR